MVPEVFIHGVFSVFQHAFGDSMVLFPGVFGDSMAFQCVFGDSMVFNVFDCPKMVN